MTGGSSSQQKGKPASQTLPAEMITMLFIEAEVLDQSPVVSGEEWGAPRCGGWVIMGQRGH